MAEERVERRLAAILAADVVGYSRLMRADETGTRTIFNAHLTELINPGITDYRGRIVKTTGDGLLVEFASVVDAVQCAVDIQRGMAERNTDVPDEKRIEFRIGVNLGDVIIEGDDIHGDGVNVAARLEGLAAPGGICISANVYGEIRYKLEMAFEDIGEQDVKNIPQPVRAYRLVNAFDAANGPGDARSGKRRWRMPAASAAAVVLILAAVGIVWLQPRAPDMEPASVDKMAFEHSDQPSIAVLPFTNMSGDKAQEYFSDGITEDIITDLSKLSKLFVVARNSSFRYKGRVVDPKQVGRALRAKYLLEGSVRRAGDQLRISAQLIDAETGGEIWSERYDGRLADTFALQDKVTARIIEAMSLKLNAKERQKLVDHRTNNFAAHDAFLLGQSHARQYTSEGFAQAIKEFERALKLDPQYSRASKAIAQVRYIRENSGLR